MSERQKIMLVTGMSGAGKTTSLRVLEDLGWEAIDNFPIRLLRPLVREVLAGEYRTPLAIGFDARTRGFAPGVIVSIAKTLSERDDLELTTQFIDGFTAAKDKPAYLKIAGVPLEIGGGDTPALKLVDVELRTEWEVGTASPSFGSRELSYLPFPGEMITERTNMGFVYVSMAEKRVVDLREFLRGRLDR